MVDFYVVDEKWYMLDWDDFYFSGPFCFAIFAWTHSKKEGSDEKVGGCYVDVGDGRRSDEIQKGKWDGFLWLFGWI
jgi:hypothetical protein